MMDHSPDPQASDEHEPPRLAPDLIREDMGCPDTQGTAASFQAGAPLDALLEALDVAARDDDTLEPHMRAYIAWVTGDKVSLHRLAKLSDDAAHQRGGARTYRHVAVLGYAAAVSKGLDEANAAALVDGLTWLAGREWFAPGRVTTLEADAVALLGIALGAVALDSGVYVVPSECSRLRAWCQGVVTASLTVLTDPWERGLLQSALYTLAPSTESARVAEAAPDLATALESRGILPLDRAGEKKAFETICALTYRTHGPDRAATQLVALQWLLRSAPAALPGRATVADVGMLLRGVERSMRRWTWEQKPTTRNAPIVQWPINNEYHVQNLLWAVLAPTFPDLEDEEHLPSFGPKHPRYDLGIPSIKLIVEAKFVRGGSTRDFASVIDEVAADASFYLRDTQRYSQIIAFVWDDSRHGEQHAELIQGLLKLPGVVDAVVLSRPGRMGPGLREEARTPE